jgi:hypothetical protein
MPQPASSPRITHLSWGRLEIDDQRSFKDAKLFPGGAREWDWRETGTHHVPGIQPADVEELVDRGATVVVLSKGVWERDREGGAALQRAAADGARRRPVPFDLLIVAGSTRRFAIGGTECRPRRWRVDDRCARRRRLAPAAG